MAAPHDPTVCPRLPSTEISDASCPRRSEAAPQGGPARARQPRPGELEASSGAPTGVFCFLFPFKILQRAPSAREVLRVQQTLGFGAEKGRGRPRPHRRREDRHRLTVRTTTSLPPRQRRGGAWGDGRHGRGPGAALEASLKRQHVTVELTDSERGGESISSRGASRREAPRRDAFGRGLLPSGPGDAAGQARDRAAFGSALAREGASVSP